MGNVNMEAYQVHYKGEESVADHLRALDIDVEKAAALPDLPTTEGKTVLTAVTDDQGDTELTYETPEVESEDIAPEFSEDAAYSEGDLVYYEGILYKFTADHAAGAWDPSEVTQTTVAAEFNELKNTLTNVVTDADEQKFNISKISQSQTDFVGYGFYNKLTNTVKIYVASRGTDAVSSNNVAIVPEGYRPAESQILCGLINGDPSTCAINNSGKIAQSLSQTYTSAFIVGEYKI